MPPFRVAKWPQSVKHKHGRAVCELFLMNARSYFTFLPECTRSQQDLKLTEVNRLTSKCHWTSELTKFLPVITLDCDFSCHSKWWHPIQFLSTAHFTFGYISALLRIYILWGNSGMQYTSLDGHCHMRWCQMNAVSIVRNYLHTCSAYTTRGYFMRAVLILLRAFNCVAAIQGQWLFKGGDYLRAASIRRKYSMLRNSRHTFAYTCKLYIIAPTLEKMDIYSCTYLGIVFLHLFMKLLKFTVSSIYWPPMIS